MREYKDAADFKKQETEQSFRVIKDRVISARDSFKHISKECESRKESNSCGRRDAPEDPVENSCWFLACPRVWGQMKVYGPYEMKGL